MIGRVATGNDPASLRAARGAHRPGSPGRQATSRPYKRPILELPMDVICGAAEPSGGVAEIAAAVRLCLASAGGPADAAFANIAQARGTAAAIRLARAYVDVRPSDAAA